MARTWDWEKIRAEYAAGATQSELSRRHHVSRKAIQKHIVSEGWVQDVSGEVNRLAEAKVAGIVAGCDPKKKAKALDAAADAKAAIIKGQQLDWQKFRQQLDEAGTFDDLKSCKIKAEILRLQHEGERKAWGIADKQEVTTKAETQAAAVSSTVATMLTMLKTTPKPEPEEAASDQS